jgi:dTDP-D-glucose 4,6-dehydratase
MRDENIISVFSCKLYGQSSRVRTEIYELRHTYKIQIITVEGFVGRCAAYFLCDSKKNIERVDYLLKKYEKKKTFASH